MPKSMVYKSGRGEKFQVNLTPMIDVTFQLIIFFIITGRFASDELAQMRLPDPYESQATQEMQRNPNRVIVNVISKAGVDEKDADPFVAGQASEYRAAGRRIMLDEAADPRQDLQDILKGQFEKWNAANPGKMFFVEIRADHRVRYVYVEPALLAAARAGIPKMNIVALIE